MISDRQLDKKSAPDSDLALDLGSCYTILAGALSRIPAHSVTALQGASF